MTATPSTWREKADRALKLVNEVKSLNLEGTDGATGIVAEQHDGARAKMAEALKLQKEAKTEREAFEKSIRVDELVKQFDLQDANDQSAWKGEAGKGAVTGSSSSEIDTEAKRYAVAEGVGDGALSAKSRLVLTTKAGSDIHVDSKALGEGTNSAGGFLVPPAFLQDMFAAVRRQGNALRRYGWLNSHPVTTDQVLIPKGSGAATVGWVSENATKPSQDQAFSQITVNIFTGAGISKVSKQLVDDSNPTAVDLSVRELGALLGILEEQAIINGTASGQPRGILNTSGVNAVTNSNTNTAQAIIDAMLDGITSIESTYFGAPSGVLVHPRRLSFIQKGKDSNNNYLFNTPGFTRTPGGGAGLLNAGPQYELLGLPVGVSANLPTNLGSGTNQDVMIIADWSEAHWFQRQDQTLDSSDQAGTAFETNQVWFRLEERAGFSAERYPAAFATVTGTGFVP